ncbi:MULTISPECIES: hypothetical protein [Pseudomonas]|uniref:hypothetical protein n=1 Tax=Pseudomonas TaxID=286 RepID=UPI0013653BA4|nr:MULTISPECIES: hypothetical protein [Pseudomonas]
MVIVHALEAFKLYEGEAADLASALLGKGKQRILLAFLSARGVCLVDTDASAFRCLRSSGSRSGLGTQLRRIHIRSGPKGAVPVTSCPSTRRNILAHTFALKKYLGGIEPVSNTCDNEHTTASLGQAETLLRYLPLLYTDDDNDPPAAAYYQPFQGPPLRGFFLPRGTPWLLTPKNLSNRMDRAIIQTLPGVQGWPRL